MAKKTATTLFLLLISALTFGSKIQLEPHKENYFIFAENNDSNYQNLEFQLSIKSALVSKLFFAYTQKSFWNIYEESAPFREHNHNPEIYLDYDLVSFGYEHESNGMDGDDTRSWDRFFIKAHYEKDGLYGSLKIWHPFYLHENEDIVKYFGLWESKFGLTGKKFSGFLINRIKSTRFDLYYDTGEFYLYATARNGFAHYGMVLFDEPIYSKAFGMGFNY